MIIFLLMGVQSRNSQLRLIKIAKFFSKYSPQIYVSGTRGEEAGNAEEAFTGHG